MFSTAQHHFISPKAYNIHRLVFITEECVYCAVRAELLQVILLYFFLFGRAMAQAVSRRPFTEEGQVRFQVSSREVCGGQSGTGTRFSPSNSIFPCQ